MNELTVHPDVYATGRSTGLLAMLETLWLREQPAGDGTMYIVSGFANYNGGVRFYPVFRNHVHNETNEVTMVLRLGHADTVRINASPGTDEAKGTQYFWLSKDCYDFFPPLTILNRRGRKRTYSSNIVVHFKDVQQTSTVRVTFEAENNLDFRLGTGPLRGTGLAAPGDWAALSRTGESRYELRLYRHATPVAAALGEHALHAIGHQGKRYGFLANDAFQTVAGVRLGAARPR